MTVQALEKLLEYKVPKITLALIRENDEVTPFAISSPDCVETFLQPLKHYSEEHFVSLHLNARHEVIGYHIVSHGTISASLVHPREVFKAALLGNCHAIIVAHNHPAGSRSPSSEDIQTTKQLIEAGRVLGISILDHVIVSIKGITSLREEYKYLWDD